METSAADLVQAMRYMERMLHLSTELFCAICETVDDCPDSVISAAQDWYSFLSEVAPPTEASGDG